MYSKYLWSIFGEAIVRESENRSGRFDFRKALGDQFEVGDDIEFLPSLCAGATHEHARWRRCGCLADAIAHFAPVLKSWPPRGVPGALRGAGAAAARVREEEDGGLQPPATRTSMLLDRVEAAGFGEEAERELEVSR